MLRKQNSSSKLKNPLYFWRLKCHNSFMQNVLEKKAAAGLSIISNAVIIILKLAAGAISGSISIISEAIHSLSDFLASVLTFFAVMKSSEPADSDHPFGHGRYEDMSGFIEGGLIIFAAFYIIFEASKKIISGASMEAETTLGIIVMSIAVVANFLVSSYLFYVGKKTNSISLMADGEHLRTDIWSSLGVLAGLVLIRVTGLEILDPMIAILVALFILKTGFSISKTTLNNLLDGALPEEDLKKIEAAIKEMKQEGVISYKDLKSRCSGPEKLIEMTLVFPEDMTIKHCHDICDKIEDKIKDTLGICNISIHAEPECAKCSAKNTGQ